VDRFKVHRAILLTVGIGEDTPAGSADNVPGPERRRRSLPLRSILFATLALVVAAGVVVALVLTLGGTGSSDWTTESTWSDNAEAGFVHYCTANATPRMQCVCILNLVRTIWRSPADEFHRAPTPKEEFLAHTEIPYCVKAYPA
jgi:hypothetical protein